MESQSTLHSPIRSRQRWLIALALLVGGLLFDYPYFFRALVAIADRLNSSLLFSILSVFWLPSSLHLFLFTDLTLYLIISLVGMALTLAALLGGRPGRIARVLLLLTLLAILVFPWLYRYQPAVVAAPGHEMRVPTQPGLLSGVVKSAQAGSEIRPCAYTLLGWSADGVLYYEDKCGTQGHVWAYAPGQDRPARQVSQSPADLIREKTYLSGVVLDWVRASDVHPADVESQVRRIAVQEGSLASPDGQWIAALVRHVYGPEDVLILR